MFKSLYPRINVRITAPFLLIIVIVAGLGAVIVTRLVAGSIQERFNNQLIDSAQAASNAIVEIERQHLATLRAATFTEGIADAIVEHDLATMSEILQPIVANSGVDDLIVFDTDGQVVIRLERVSAANPNDYNTQSVADIADWPSVQRIRTGTSDTVGNKFVDVISSDSGTTIYFSGPVITEDRILLGGINVGIRANNFVFQIREQALSSVSLYLNDGTLLGTTFVSANPADISLSTERAAQIAQVVASESPTEERLVGGADYQILYAPLELRSNQIGLIAVALPSEFLTDRISTSRDVLVVLFSGMFVVVTFLGLLITRSIVFPVQRLVDTTRSIREGDLTKRVGLRMPDELGELSVSFDHMTDQLVASNQQIHDLYIAQVQETTQLDAVLKSINDVVIVRDQSGQIILLNQAAERLITRLRNTNEVAFEALVDLCRNPEYLAEPQQISLDRWYFNAMAASVTLPTGGLLGYITVLHDITGIVEAERVKDELILQLSHELRTPLTAARGYIELVQMMNRETLNDRSQGFIGKTVVHLSTLERMVNQVVDVSAILANKMMLEPEETDVVPLINTVADRQRAYIQERELELNLVIPVDTLCIEADMPKLSQVLDNLLLNAINYTLPGGRIQITLEDSGHFISIAIADSGVGIDRDEQDKVFERMYRGRSADAGPTDARGLGLGLYISKHIVELHQGRIVLDSEPDVGTIVTVLLPVQQNGTT